MAIPGLMLIGEAINDSVPSTKEMFDRGDLAGIQALAAEQAAAGAHCIDVNVGRRGADFMAAVVRKVQAAVAAPLSIDSPDVEYLRAGLAAYEDLFVGSADSYGVFQTDKLEELSAFLVDNGLITQPIPPDRYATNEFAEGSE